MFTFLLFVNFKEWRTAMTDKTNSYSSLMEAAARARDSFSALVRACLPEL